MDGFKETENVIVVGATNFEKALDPAIIRPGRFDKTIHVPLPDIKGIFNFKIKLLGRKSIFDLYLNKIKHSKIDSDILAIDWKIAEGRE